MKKSRNMSILTLLIVIISVIYALLWLQSRKTYPIEFGISFNQTYAESLGLNWKQAFEDMLRQLQPKYVRIAAMWSEIEPEEEYFDFSDVDWMMNRAADFDTKILLVVGQKAPRWPECHVPEWLDYAEDGVEEHFLNYVEKVVERYKDNNMLEYWQVENEPFIKFRFGECENYNERLVEEEIELVRKLDPDHKILITDSGELSTWRKASKLCDLFGTTMYRIVRTKTGKIFTYDWLPPAAYRYKAKLWGNDLSSVFISELQAEPWFGGDAPTETSIKVQEETMNLERMEKHFEYASKTGFPRAYLWGVEWWYYMKIVHGDRQYWDFVKDQLAK